MLSSQYPRGAGLSTALGSLIEQVRVAKEAGFRSIWGLQHFLGNLDTFQPLPLLSRLCAETDGMQVGTNILILPLHHPVDVAEQFATLDQLCGGNAVAGVGLGYRQHEFDAFGISMRDRVSRLTEAVEVMRLLWSAEPVTFDGRHFRLDNQQIGIPPARVGGPPIWVGANVDAGIERAARIGDALIALHTVKPRRLRSVLETFRAERARVGRPPAREYPVFREVSLHRDGAKARSEARPFLLGEAEAYARYGVSFLVDRFDDLLEHAYVVGDPSHCIAAFAELESLGITDVIVRVQWAGMPQAAALRTLTLLGEEVLPRFATTAPR